MSLIDLISTDFGLILDGRTAISALHCIAQDAISFLRWLASMPLLLLTTLQLFDFAVVKQLLVDLQWIEEHDAFVEDFEVHVDDRQFVHERQILINSLI